MANSDKLSGSMVRLIASVLPMVETMTGVDVGKALAGALRSPEGQEAINANPALAEMALGALQGSAGEVKAAEATTKPANG